VASADGAVSVNPTGNSGLATGGSGDVLSGIIGALLGQGLSGRDAAVLGCYLHGLAADLATTSAGEDATRGAAARCGMERGRGALPEATHGPDACGCRAGEPGSAPRRARRSLLPGEVAEWLPYALGATEAAEAPPRWQWRRVE
jgi:hypothetical protein